MIAPLIFIAMPLVGLALLWGLRLVCAGRQTGHLHWLQAIVAIFAWQLIVLAIVFPLAVSMIGWVMIAATAVIAVMAIRQYRASERRSLLWMLAISAERGLPLPIAARAFAKERSDGVGRGAVRLADALEAGMSLPDAFERSGNRLPTDAALAARLAEATGGSPAALLEAARAGISREREWRPLFEKGLYFILLFYVMVGILTFMMIKIVPAFEKIFSDFDTELPQMTQLAVTVSHFVYTVGWLLPLVALAANALLFFGVLYYIGWLRWEPPPIHWLTRPFHRAAILTALARVVEDGTPIGQGLSLLAQWYPQPAIRRRLALADEQVHGGQPWCEVLRRHKLMAASDAAVIHAAERARNLPWAMREMALRNRRRVQYRMAVLNNIVLPLSIVAYALPIGFMVIALFLPLIKLIMTLT